MVVDTPKSLFLNSFMEKTNVSTTGYIAYISDIKIIAVEGLKPCPC